MPRKRSNPEDGWLPQRVYRGKSSYEYRSKSGECFSLRPLPKDGIETELIKSDVWDAYKKALTTPTQVDHTNSS